jgi:hypothetical protein
VKRASFVELFELSILVLNYSMFDFIFTKISIKYSGTDFLRLYQILDSLHQNGRKLSEFIGLVTVSTAVHLKNLKIMQRDLNGEHNL